MQKTNRNKISEHEQKSFPKHHNLSIIINLL